MSEQQKTSLKMIMVLVMCFLFLRKQTYNPEHFCYLACEAFTHLSYHGISLKGALCFFLCSDRNFVAFTQPIIVVVGFIASLDVSICENVQSKPEGSSQRDS